MNTSTFFSKAISLSFFIVIPILTLDALGHPPAGFDFTVPQDVPYEPGKLLVRRCGKKKDAIAGICLEILALLW